jgi:hypothetical protein
VLGNISSSSTASRSTSDYAPKAIKLSRNLLL